MRPPLDFAISSDPKFTLEMEGVLNRARLSFLAGFLSHLRMRNAVMFYHGKDEQDFLLLIQREFGREVANLVRDNMCALERTKLSTKEKELLRKSIGRGTFTPEVGCSHF